MAASNIAKVYSPCMACLDNSGVVSHRNHITSQVKHLRKGEPRTVDLGTLCGISYDTAHHAAIQAITHAAIQAITIRREAEKF